MEVITGNGCLTWDMVKSICKITVEETEDKCFYKMKVHNEAMEHTWNIKVSRQHSSQYDLVTILLNPNETRYQTLIHKYIRESQLEEMLGEIKI